jgi:hypothetical protein
VRTSALIVLIVPGTSQRVAAGGSSHCALLRHTLQLGIQQLLQKQARDG